MVSMQASNQKEFGLSSHYQIKLSTLMLMMNASMFPCFIFII